METMIDVIKPKFVKIIVKNVNKPPRIVKVPNELNSFQAIVGGLIEVLDFKGNIKLVCNALGKNEGLSINFTWIDDNIAGDVFFTTTNEVGDFISLTDEQVSILKRLFVIHNIAYLPNEVDFS